MSFLSVSNSEFDFIESFLKVCHLVGHINEILFSLIHFLLLQF